MSEIFDKAWIEKPNVWNDLRYNNMTLQELRFFSIYLSKIDKENISTRVVKFPLEDFRRIMGFNRLNVAQLRASTDSLLTKIVHLPTENGGYTSFQLFKKCTVDKDSNNQWYVSIDAHDDALPMMFGFQNRYFQYRLWNALRLKSTNQVRMYEILKQYENIGRREVSVEKLRDQLGIEKNEYERWERFRVRVLDSCQQALKESTDICFEYERGKVGKGGKWLTIIFYIFKNTEYKDPLSLEKFIDIQPPSEPVDTSINEEPVEEMTILDEPEEPEIPDYGTELANFIGELCDYEFNKDQVWVLKDLVVKAVCTSHRYYNSSADLDIADYLIEMLHKMAAQPGVRNRFAYLRKMIEADIAKREEES